VPYSLVSNDAKMMTMPSREWAEFINDGIDALARDEETQPAMVSIGLHCRIAGHPNRFAGLLRVLDHVVKLPNVWIASRLDIAQYWSEVNGR
jgi:allantoinase